MMQILRVLAAVSVASIVCPVASADGDAVHGKQLFNRCAVCHAIEGPSKSGPTLNGVFERKAGAVEGYRYSTAMANSDLVWNDATLDAYLSGPTKMLRGTCMTMGVMRPDDRADIIAYLKTLVAP